MQFDMNRTWSQATSLVRGNFQLLALISGIFMLLPGLVMVVAMPELLALPSMSDDPEQMSQRLAAEFGSFFAVMLVIMLISCVGYAAMIALIGPERPTVGGAIAKGLKALPTLVAALVLFLVIYLLLALVLGMIVGLVAVVLGAVAGETGAGLFATIVIMCVVFYVITRLSLTMPIVVLENVLNPLRAFVRSWRLTAPFHWRIFGFFLLLFVVYLVLSLLLLTLMSGLGLAVEPASGLTLVFGIISGLVGMAVAMIASGILVSMHEQLSGTSSAAVSATFE